MKSPPLPGETPSLRLYCLGRLRLEAAGQPVRFGKTKSGLLLAYLALHPGPQLRAQVAGRFWGEAAELKARSSLRTELYTLRRQLGPQLLVEDYETVALNPALSLWVDVHEFEAGAQRLLASNAYSLPLPFLDLYQHDLLVDVDEEWVRPHRQRLRDCYHQCLHHLLGLAEQQEDYPNSIQFARTLLTSELADEEAYYQLMRAYWQLGQRVTALRHYQQCCRVLKEEVDAEPSARLNQLADLIRRTDSTARPATVGSSTLPPVFTTFVGRQQELMILQSWLRPAGEAATEAEVRFVMLVGPGGVGKSRLALQIAGEIAHDFADGVRWLDLAALTQEELIPTALAQLLSVPEEGKGSRLAALADLLAERRLLLVLDNCEHLAAGCSALIHQLLVACPHLKLLATSRVTLSVAGGRIWPLAPLPLPGDALSWQGWDEGTALAELVGIDAVAFFVQRAQAADPTFVVTPVNVAQVMQLCRRLEGLPLALELAATRLRDHTIDQLVERLERVIELSETNDPRQTNRSQEGLKGAIRWSYQLLGEPERLFFRRLGVFVGSFTAEAVEAIAWDLTADPAKPGQPGGVGALATLGLLARLGQWSLLTMTSDGAVERYRMLETVRTFAGEILAQAGELAILQRRHLDYFVAWAERCNLELTGPCQLAAFQRLRAEEANLRAALSWAVSAGEASAALRLAVALHQLWEVRGQIHEGWHWLQSAVGLVECLPPLAEDRRLYGRGLIELGRFTRLRKEFPQARQLMERGRAIAHQLNDQWLTARVLLQLGHVALGQGDELACEQELSQALALFRRLGDLTQMAITLQYLGSFYTRIGDFARATASFEAALEQWAATQNNYGATATLMSWGLMRRAQGDFAGAQLCLEQSLQMARRFDARRLIARSLEYLGEMAYTAGQTEVALPLLQEALILFYEAMDRCHFGSTLLALAGVAGRSGELLRAAQMVVYGEQIAAKVGPPAEPPLQTLAERVTVDLHAAGLTLALRRLAEERNLNLTLGDLVALAQQLKPLEP
jgi:predicted ATPase/DNA-binding SARP family transcriptional activator